MPYDRNRCTLARPVANSLRNKAPYKLRLYLAPPVALPLLPLPPRTTFWPPRIYESTVVAAGSLRCGAEQPPREEYSRCIYVTTRWYICINCMHMRSPSSTSLSISPRPFVFLWLPPPSIDTFLRIFVALNHYIVYRYCSSPTGVPT